MHRRCKAQHAVSLVVQRVDAFAKHIAEDPGERQLRRQRQALNAHLTLAVDLERVVGRRHAELGARDGERDVGR